MITSEVVDQACNEVNEYNDERMMKEFDSFFREQPSICDFITEVTSESPLQLQELSLFLSYMVFKIVRAGETGALAPVSAEKIEAAYRESESWIDRLNREGEQAGLPEDPEPHLIQYVISELNQPLEDGKLLDDEEKGEVFFVLKTIISSLTRSPLGQDI